MRAAEPVEGLWQSRCRATLPRLHSTETPFSIRCPQAGQVLLYLDVIVMVLALLKARSLLAVQAILLTSGDNLIASPALVRSIGTSALMARRAIYDRCLALGAADAILVALANAFGRIKSL